MQNKTTSQAHQWLKEYLSKGNLTVDATCGNGHDTLFLAEQVGVSGKVFAYDIQSVAINATDEKLLAANLHTQVQFFNHSHEYLEKDLLSYKGKIQAIIFNLGYLPGGDKNITTNTESTLNSIKQAFNLLKTGGILCVTSYPGHPEGAHEDQSLSLFFETLKNTAGIKLYSTPNTKRPAPKLYFIRKN